MAKMVKSETLFGATKDVLLNPESAFAIGVQVGSTGVSTENGRKIIKAGTPVGSTTSALEVRETVLSVANDESKGVNAQGVLLHDVDVTEGNANATLVVSGVIDLSKCPTIHATAKTALKHIIFINGGKA